MTNPIADPLVEVPDTDVTSSLVRLDTRGTGHSELPADPASLRFDRLADDVEALREALGEQQVDVLAHSAGCLVAQAWARADAVSAPRARAGDAFHRAKCETAAHCFVHLASEFEQALAAVRAGWQPLAQLALDDAP